MMRFKNIFFAVYCLSAWFYQVEASQKEMAIQADIKKNSIEKFVVVVECAIEHQGKLLLIKRPMGVHAGGFLAFPGGKVEYKDGDKSVDILKEAVKREVFEELGLRLIDPLYFIMSSYFVNPDQDHILDVIFLCRIEKSTLEIQPSAREVAGYDWVSPAEILIHKDCPIWLQRQILALIEHL